MYLGNFISAYLLMAQSEKHFISTTSTEQSNLLKHLGGMGPYVQGTGFGISTDFERHMKPDKVFVFARHGERYPTKPIAKRLRKVFNKLKKANVVHVEGPLSFVSDWEYFIPSSEWLGKETIDGDFSGLQTMYDFGTDIWHKYGYLYANEHGQEILPLFAASKPRCVESAEEFGKGFFNGRPDRYESKARLVILDEDPHRGADTLTASVSCKNYIKHGEYFRHPFIGKNMVAEAQRLNELSPGYGLSPEDVYSLAVYCAFELNALGQSKVCDALSMNVFVELEYFKDIELWYEKAAHPLSFALGSIYVDAMIQLFDQKETAQNLFFSFTHDTELLYFMSAIGLFEYQTEELRTGNMNYARFFKTSELTPMGARIVVERYTVQGEKFVRLLLNDAVIPIPECQDGPISTCKLSTLAAIVRKKMEQADFVEECRIPKKRPRHLSFYWSWPQTLQSFI